MTHTPYQSDSRLHWVAMFMPLFAMVTIFFGAMTTTEGAGMIFPDYPTSDGQGMFAYPFLSLITTMWDNPKDYHRFLEHGHRLVATAIGIYAIVLCVLGYMLDQRRWVGHLGLAILICIIIQGLLGGFRVLLNDLGFAMVHGLFASFVLSLMGVMALVTAKSWLKPVEVKSTASLITNRSLATFVFAALIFQYCLGGGIRHFPAHPIFGNPMHHLHTGLTVLVFTLLTTISCWFAGGAITRWGGYLGVAMSLQVLLGLATYVTKYGYPPIGYQAIAGSYDQVFMRTFHMMSGTIVMAVATQLLIQVWRARKADSQIVAQPT